MRFRLRRDTSPQFFVDWQSYLRVRARDRDHTLFGVLEELARSAREHMVDVNEKGKDPQAISRARATAGLPWLTLVVGTGCLNDPAQTASVTDPLPAQLGRVAAELEVTTLSDSTLAETLVARFAQSLLDARRTSSTTAASSPVTDAERQIAARVLLCAALSSDVYRLSLTQRVGPRPRDAELVPLPSRVAPTAPERRALLLAEDLRTVLTALKGAVPADRQFVAKLAQRIHEDLSTTPGAGLRARDVDALAELAWHLMMAGTGHYLGWGELFTLLSVRTSELVSGMRTPYFADLTQVRDFLVQGLERATVASWNNRKAGKVGERSAFYDQVAATARRQAVIHAGAVDGKESFPLSAIFVTGFDLEVELALLYHATSFTVVAPFYVHAEVGTRTEVGFTWLMKSVDGDSGPKTALTDITSPTGWKRVPSDRFVDIATGHPVLVRLTGSPLMDPPNDTELVNELVREGIPRSAESTKRRVTPALLVDEHAGLHHWLPEMDPLRENAIPKDTFSNTQWSPRFWVLVGVQISDAAVRQRVAALLSTIPLRRLRAEDDAELSLPGVALIRASEAADRDVLNWRGIDVVRADFPELTPDLADCARRLKSHETWWTKGEVTS